MKTLPRWLALLTGVMSVTLPALGAGFDRAAIYEKATNLIRAVAYLKPAEVVSNRVETQLAPLVLQQVREGANLEPLRFGTLQPGNVVDVSRPAIYFRLDSAAISGRVHPQITYCWFYPPTKAAPRRLRVQGVRITLDAHGQPAIWEMLTDASGARLMFVSRALEIQARSEYGPPQANRRFSVERAAAREVVVPRIVEDGPVPMGPMVYLAAESADPLTLACRCMPAQASSILSQQTYVLLDLTGAPALEQTQPDLHPGLAFRPGAPEPARGLEEILRLPRSF